MGVEVVKTQVSSVPAALCFDQPSPRPGLRDRLAGKPFSVIAGPWNTCAGIIRDNLLHKMTDDDWEAVIATHLRGTFLAARAAQAPMVEQKRGSMVLISSVSALGNRGQANYSAAKAGIQGLAKTLSLELGRFGIRANCVAPGFIVTAMTAQTAERIGMSFEDFQAAGAAQTPLGRVGEPDDVAGVVAFLCSDDAAYVSGQVIYVRGGP